MNSAPPLPVHNQFFCLEIEGENPHTPNPQAEKLVIVTPTPLLPHSLCHLHKWECKLPQKYVIAAVPSPKSLIVKVEIQTTDTTKVRSGPALIDSGATGLFMDWRYVECYKLTTRKLHHPIVVYNVDGSPNEAGCITETVEVILRLNGHSERVNCAVTNLGKHNLILGYTWLQEHNPKINWQTQEIIMSQCPDRCHTCQSNVHDE